VQVLFVRHAYAGDPDPDTWPDDNKRPLTKKGARKFLPAAQGLKGAIPAPDKVLSSASARTWQTARLLSDQAGWVEPDTSAALEDGSDPSDITEYLNQSYEDGMRTIVLVGHGPQLTSLMSYMLTGNKEEADLKLKKGGAALIDYNKPGESELKWVMPRKALARLGT
jgi:phosphohistidine phosphatase